MAKHNWTVENVPDLSGRVIIVTGANSGIGFEAARAFARRDARVILACRDLGRGGAALNKLRAEIPAAQLTVMRLDLASQASVRRFAAEYRASHDRLDLLIANAGIMAAPYATTEDGFESQFATNHLGHFALAGLLIDLLIKTPGSRIVSVSSAAHRLGTMDFDNLMFDAGRGYTPWLAYGRSKLANLLFTYELQRRLAAAGAETIALAAHPGSSSTNLGRNLTAGSLSKLVGLVSRVMSQDAAMGALPTIRAAVDPNVCGGEYYGPERLMKGYPVIVSSTAASHDKHTAARLWEASEQLTGVRYLVASGMASAARAPE